MIDYFKAIVPLEVGKSWTSSSDIEFTESFNSATGEYYSSNATYNNLKLSVSNKRAYVKGSIHKYLIGNNYSDFTLSNYRCALDMLGHELGINWQHTTLTSFEFGVNITPSISVANVLEKYIECGSNPFTEMEGGVCSEAEQYRIKAYDKGVQERLAKEVLRYEVHTKKMQFLKRKGIVILNPLDLKSEAIWQDLGQKLLDFHEKMKKADFVREDEMTAKEIDFYFAGSSSTYWSMHRRRNKNTHKTKWRNFVALQRRYLGRDVHAENHNKMSEKIGQLIAG